MIHIADTRVARRYGDFFIRQIHKLEEVKVYNTPDIATLYFRVPPLLLCNGVYIHVSLRLNFICIFCPFALYGVWVGITFLSSLYELVCYAHAFPCVCN